MSKAPDTATAAKLNELAMGLCPDPFAWLGPHRVGDGTVIRTVQPQANAVSLCDSSGAALAPMERVHADGVFEARLARPLTNYRLRVAPGSPELIDDPYRFTSPLGDIDLHLLGEGAHEELYRKLGATCCQVDSVAGVHFAVWAPNALRVSVIGDFNDWDGRRHVMRRHPSVGVWDIFIPGVAHGSHYKFELLDRHGRLLPLKSDPLAHHYEGPPGNAARVYNSSYCWSDDEWMNSRRHGPRLDAPISIYEVHLGSWRRNGGRWLGYREAADALVDYVSGLGFTHIELLPVTEHPFDGSWGYQPTGMFAPTQRFGEPDDFRYFVDRCHGAGISVIVDWVPAHFPRDEHALARFDGSALYEHEDPRRGEHADWGTLIYNLGRREVANFLIASALYWINEFHVDGLRVDAVASMLYLDYSRNAGDWLPNEHGGNENLEAVHFLRRLNELVHAYGAETYAEESTAWPAVSRPVYSGGLGFTYKWNMGWMNDTLRYMQEDPVHRKFHHDKLTFGLVYAFSENFVLPLSHDEVVHGKRSLIGRMPGDAWQKFANLRAYLCFMFAHPGKKLLFMGDEFAQHREWNHDVELDWHLLEYKDHKGVQQLVSDLNRLYRSSAALHEIDFEARGFQWLDWQDSDASIVAWLRLACDGRFVVCVSNFTPVVRYDYELAVPIDGAYAERINTDAADYGGSGIGNLGLLESTPSGRDGGHVLKVTLPPLASLIIEPR